MSDVAKPYYGAGFRADDFALRIDDEPELVVRPGRPAKGRRTSRRSVVRRTTVERVR